MNGSKDRIICMIVGSKHLSFVRVIDHDNSSDSEQKRSKRINDYCLVKKIGKGSFSKVYLGVDQLSQVSYAIKQINIKDLCRTSAGIFQLEREVRLMRSFSHPNIIKLKEVLMLEQQNCAYLVLEYADLGSLDSMIKKHTKLTLPTIFSVIKQITSAVKYLHEMGFVHQDIKPANILIESSGKAVLADFGIGHSFQSAAMVVGSPAYQAPECLQGCGSDDEDFQFEDDSEESVLETDPQEEDVWSLGVTLYQLLFGRLPFEGENLFEIICTIKENPLYIPEDTDPQIAELLQGMLKVNPSERITISEIQNHPLVANAPELANDLPKPETVIEPSVEYDTYKAEVCTHGFSFVKIAMSIQKKLSLYSAPFPPIRRMSSPAEIPPFELDSLSKASSRLKDSISFGYLPM